MHLWYRTAALLIRLGLDVAVTLHASESFVLDLARHWPVLVEIRLSEVRRSC